MYYIETDKINKYSGLFIQMMLNKSIIDCGFGYVLASIIFLTDGFLIPNFIIKYKLLRH